jgi:hypothetical protein
MSTKFPGGFITKNYVAPTTTSASGIWTLEQQEQAQQAGIWPFGGPFNYIEDVFSTWLYAGNSSTQSIVNNIDLSTNGGMVWTKSRNAAYDNTVYDTARGTGSTKALYTDTTDAQGAFPSYQDLTAFNTNGYSIGSPILLNETGKNYVSWTFRKQPKFFDVVTYTGTGSATTIPHSLGSVPGCIIVKRTNTAGFDWFVYHRSTGNTNRLLLNDTVPAASGTSFWNDTTPTSTVFTLGNNVNVNQSGGSYVAYIFAHDAGGFGLTGTDNVISCGSVTLDGSGNATVNLGYEPQWVMIKATSTTGVWYMHDTMRGLDLTTYTRLFANTSQAEATSTPTYIAPSSTGFNLINGFTSPGVTLIYIAIRRGPMKVPTDATKVFKPTATAVTTGTTVTTGFVTDLQMANYLSGGGANTVFTDRLRGISNTSAASPTLGSANTNAEITSIDYLYAADNTGWKQGSYSSGGNSVRYDFLRAPSFFDEVCYTGTGSNMTVSHNLGVAPTLMIVRGRNSTGAGQWRVYDVFNGNDNYMALNTTAATASGYGAYWNTTTPTSSAFYVGSSNTTNTGTYVAYLFATCAGVSKVGSYTGNGSTQTIDCGLTAGARFVLIKRTDATGGWYVYDTARGMTTLTDPYLFLNSTAAEAASLGSVTTVATGFALNSAILAAINTSSATYIFLAIA